MQRVTKPSPRNHTRLWLPAAVVLGAGQARADNIEWSNINGGLFSIGANWIGGVVPGAGDDAHFGRNRDPNFPTVYTVTFSTSPTNHGIVVEDDRVTFDLNGNAYLLTNDFDTIRVGTVQGGLGRLTIMDGAVATTAANPNVFIGNGGAPGALIISTGGQLLGPHMSVGFGGPGSLLLQSGGDLVGLDFHIAEFAGGTGTATITGSGSAAAVEDLIVGEDGPGTLNINAGGQVDSTSGVLGLESTGIGTVQLDGVNSRWTTSGSVVVGVEGQGTLSISAGARLQSSFPVSIGSGASGTGTVHVDGVNSRLTSSQVVVVGSFGQGTLNITAGAQVESASGVLGAGVSGIGTVLVDGPGSLWTNSGFMTIGGARATLNITNGGRVQNSQGNISAGPNAGSTAVVTVDGDGSLWMNSADLDVGRFRNGSLNVTGGALVQSAAGTVGNESVATGTATIDGEGSGWINSSDLVVGVLGNGTLGITAGGAVQSADAFIAQFGGQSSVDVSGAGSMWTITGDLSVGGDIGQGVDGGAGTLEIGPGGAVSAGSMFIFPDDLVDLHGGTLDVSRVGHAFDSTGDLEFHSGILHAGVVSFGLLNQGGTLAPGHSAGTTTIEGNYTQLPAGTMEIEIGGTTPGTEFDAVMVGGDAILDGALDLHLINGFVPSPDQLFVVLDAAAGITGAFANVASGQRLPTSDGAGSFAVHYGDGSPFDPTQIVLSDFGVCIADFNDDGAVNTLDVLAFLNAWGYRDPSADCDANGVVDTRDVLCFLNAWNAGC